jgi:hypothetical protein
VGGGAAGSCGIDSPVVDKSIKARLYVLHNDMVKLPSIVDIYFWRYNSCVLCSAARFTLCLVDLFADSDLGNIVVESSS